MQKALFDEVMEPGDDWPKLKRSREFHIGEKDGEQVSK